MPTNEWKFKTSDNIELVANSWEVKNPKAVIVLVHGHGEYCLRYEHVAQFYNKNSISFYSFDLRGHGRSGGQRGHTPSYEALIGDVSQFVEYVKEQTQGIPLFVYGHSMGGNLVLNYGLTDPAGVDGIICSSPWIKLAFEPPQFKLVLAAVMDKVYPSLTQKSGLEVSALCHDEEVCKKYANDPLVHDLISVGLYNGMYKKGIEALARVEEFKKPIVLFHGNQDRLTSFQASKEFAGKAGKNLTFMEWDGMFHETHNEPDKQNVFNFSLGWVNQQIL